MAVRTPGGHITKGKWLSPNSHQLPIGPELWVGPHELLPHPCWSVDWLGLVQSSSHIRAEVWLSSSSLGLMHVTRAAVGSWQHIQKTAFHSCPPAPNSFILSPLLLWCSLGILVVDLDVLFRADHSTVSIKPWWTVRVCINCCPLNMGASLTKTDSKHLWAYMGIFRKCFDNSPLNVTTVVSPLGCKPGAFDQHHSTNFWKIRSWCHPGSWSSLWWGQHAACSVQSSCYIGVFGMFSEWEGRSLDTASWSLSLPEAESEMAFFVKVCLLELCCLLDAWDSSQLWISEDDVEEAEYKGAWGNEMW